MKTINVSEATNNQLDWLVAACEGLVDERDPYPRHAYSISPEAMWPIIEREGINLSTIFVIGLTNDKWGAFLDDGRDYIESIMGGPTQLIAAARCYVVGKLGETVEVPEELT